MMATVERAIEGVLAIVIIIVLLVALYPVLELLNPGAAILFVVLIVLMLVAMVLGLARRYL